MDYIEKTPLSFPNTNKDDYQISVWIMDIFKKIFIVNPDNRVSYEEILQHKILDYFKHLMKHNLEGQRYRPLKDHLPIPPYQFNPSIIKSFVK